MKIIELNDNGEIRLYCPFCGELISNPGEENSICKHTLFIASVEGGFDYISPKIKIDEDYESLEIDGESLTLNEYIETIDQPDSVCFEVAHFSGFSGFMAFGRE